jgi:hypothetical protein
MKPFLKLRFFVGVKNKSCDPERERAFFSAGGYGPNCFPAVAYSCQTETAFSVPTKAVSSSRQCYSPVKADNARGNHNREKDHGPILQVSQEETWRAWLTWNLARFYPATWPVDITG